MPRINIETMHYFYMLSYFRHCLSDSRLAHERECHSAAALLALRATSHQSHCRYGLRGVRLSALHQEPRRLCRALAMAWLATRISASESQYPAHYLRASRVTGPVHDRRASHAPGSAGLLRGS